MKNLQYFISEKLKSIIPSYTKLVVGITGGVDSVAAVHLLSSLKGYSVEAINIFHEHSIANRDASIKVCQQLSIPLRLDSFHSGVKQNIEETRRNFRYKKIQDLLDKDEIFITSHHLDDNVENFFIRLLRGSGLDGLASIQAIRPFGKSFQVRPFLDIPKAELIGYCIRHQLGWIEDIENTDLRFTRNLIRKKILPNIEKYFPHYRDTISRSIQHLAEAKSLLPASIFSDTLELSTLGNQPDAIKIHFIRQWISHQINTSPNTGTCKEILKQLASSSQKISIPIAGFILTREDEVLKIKKLAQV